MEFKVIGQGNKPNDGFTPAERRADRVRALEEERRGYEVRGAKDRVAAVDAELRAARGEVKERTAPKKATVSKSDKA